MKVIPDVTVSDNSDFDSAPQILIAENSEESLLRSLSTGNEGELSPFELLL